MTEIKVKRCFGKYGNTDVERIFIDPVTEEEIKRIIGCTLLCPDIDMCCQCYWDWYFKNKADRRKARSLSECIYKFMDENHISYQKTGYRGKK